MCATRSWGTAGSLTVPNRYEELGCGQFSTEEMNDNENDLTQTVTIGAVGKVTLHFDYLHANGDYQTPSYVSEITFNKLSLWR